ncbi:hypothetical protein K503DRAFT_467716 [Rhizopogon vinicolor AM-OR11-026]|uniref:Uncharacterized protein n=1 Tax=Rhizopogon vinicolor AM-OR11-026 TaxID=1314800 RepID=A0A1B7N9Z9_9AGAM|nr:hypothetical protein K503DRAFT_467716 [Rhizopogon vinicolor AM-OR11-026]
MTAAVLQRVVLRNCAIYFFKIIFLLSRFPVPPTSAPLAQPQSPSHKYQSKTS